MKVLGFNWSAIPLIVVGIGGSLVVPWEAVAGPSRAAHPSDSWRIELIENAAESLGSREPDQPPEEGHS